MLHISEFNAKNGKSAKFLKFLFSGGTLYATFSQIGYVQDHAQLRADRLERTCTNISHRSRPHVCSSPLPTSRRPPMETWLAALRAAEAAHIARREEMVLRWATFVQGMRRDWQFWRRAVGMPRVALLALLWTDSDSD